MPRGRILQNGTLTLAVSNSFLQRQAVTGGFGGSQWNRTSPDPPPTEIFSLFDKVKKNQNEWRDHSLLDNLKPAKARPVAVFGTIAPAPDDPDPMHVNYIAEYGRSYDFFICLNSDDVFRVGTPDADIDFDILVDRQNLDREIGFWTDGWETSHGITPSNYRAKLDFGQNLLHLASIMFGGTTECGDDGSPAILLPGWQQGGAAGVLFNGQPIAGQLDLAQKIRSDGATPIDGILGKPITFGARVRVNGNLVLDCGHGWEHDCDEDTASTQNQEIHPIYSLDVVQDFRLPRPLALLTGAWSNDDAGTYYLRQIGNAVWWLGISADEGRTFANVFRGTLQNNQISGNWADVPLGQTANAGTLAMTAGSGQLSTNLSRTAATGGFAGDSWDKLFDVGGRTIIVVFDSATTSATSWPKMSAPVPFEIAIGNQRIEAQPTNPHSVKLPSGQQVTQVDLNERLTVDPPQLGPLRATASFVGYRVNWTIAESDQKPGLYQQTMKKPSVLPAASLQLDKTLVTDRDSESVRKAALQSASGSVPDLVIHYHIEQVGPPK